MTTHLSRARAYARFVPREEVSDVSTWSFDPVADTAQTLSAAQLLAEQHVVELEQQRVQAHAQGWTEGLQAGRDEGIRQMQAFMAERGHTLAAMLEQLSGALSAELQQVSQTAALSVAQLVQGLARQVVRRELKLSPQTLVPVVMDALQMLAPQEQHCALHLHPEDMQTLGEEIMRRVSAQVVLVADPSVDRGGCILESPQCRVDATLQSRWTDAVQSIGLNSVWDEPGPAHD